jgi:hypothetical protein
MSRNRIIPGFDYRPDREPGSGGGHAVEWTRSQWQGFRELHESKGGTVCRFKDEDGTHTTQFHNRLNGRPDLAMEAYGL